MSEEPSATAAKQALRRRLRAQRRARADAETAAASLAIASAAALAPWIEAARCLAAYVASDGEPDLAAILGRARTNGATILLPRRRADGDLDLVVQAGDGPALVRSADGILEPPGAAADLARLAAPAVLLTPAVALDAHGGRLGRGGGAYDRLIARLRPRGWRIVGVCHEAEVVGRLPLEAHDQAMDAILTEAGFRLAEQLSGRRGDGERDPGC